MVFNPTLSSDIGYEQSVGSTSSTVSTVSSILQGLGVFDKRETRAPTADEKFLGAVRQFQAMEDVPDDLSGWSPSVQRRFVANNPQFASEFRQALEVSGNESFSQEQAELKAKTDWMATPSGQWTQSTAMSRFPNDPGSQRAFAEQEYTNWVSAVATQERLKREVEAGTLRGNLSEQAWDASGVILQNTVGLATDTMVGVYEAVRMGQEVTLGQVAPELSRSLPGLANIKLTQDNFAAVARQVKDIILRTETQRLTGIYGASLQLPSQDYQNNLFAEFDSIVEDIATGVSPQEINQRAQARTDISARNLIEKHGLAPVVALSKAFPNNPQAQVAIYQALDGLRSADGMDIFTQALTGGTFEADDSTKGGAQEAASVAIQTLNDPSITPENRSNLLQTLPSVLERADAVADANVYRSVLSPAALRDNPEQAFNFVQSEMSRELDKLGQEVDKVFGALFTDGQNIVFQRRVAQGSVSEDDLNRVNAKLDIIAASGPNGKALVDAFLADFQPTSEIENWRASQGRRNAGSDPVSLFPSVDLENAAGRNAPRTSSISAPQGAVELAPFAFGSSTMKPIITLDGASELAQPYAQERMQGMLEGPFKALQERLGRPLIINDAIAKAGSTREVNRRKSRHFHGDAIDISLAGMSNEEKMELVEAAIEVGFQGFGFGENILHIDLGHRRAWDYNNSTFAGQPIDTLKELVRSGSVPRAELAANTGLPQSIRDALATEPTDEPTLEYDDNEGTPSGLIVFGQQPQPTPVDNTREDQPRSESTDRVREDQEKLAQAFKPEVREEIRSLTESLTSQGLSREAIIEYLLSTGEPRVEGPR